VKCPNRKIAVISLVVLAVWLFVVLPLMYFPWPPSREGTFWGLDSTAWTAISALANAILTFLTGGLLVFAVYQVLTVKRDAKITRTLAACERYDIDPVLDQITRRLSDAFDDGSLHREPTQYAVDLNSLFNYFESIAIGVSRGHYDADIVRDQFETIMNSHIEIVNGIGNWSSAASGLKGIDHFDQMLALNEKWKNNHAT
jgi:hypothetical protein